MNNNKNLTRINTHQEVRSEFIRSELSWYCLSVLSKLTESWVLFWRDIASGTSKQCRPRQFARRNYPHPSGKAFDLRILHQSTARSHKAWWRQCSHSKASSRAYCRCMAPQWSILKPDNRGNSLHKRWVTLRHHLVEVVMKTIVLSSSSKKLRNN